MTTFNYDHIVVRYGELSTKGKNRKDFTKALTNNIKKRLRAYPGLSYRTLHDGLYIELNGENYELIKEDLKQVFGYAYFSGAILVDRDIEEIKKTALELTKIIRLLRWFLKEVISLFHLEAMRLIDRLLVMF